MANADHLKTLRQGVDAWNAWRKQHPVKPDLSQADLSAADLREADLNGANLNGADLNGANLNGANLIEANLRGANLSRANLAYASLDDVDITNTNLTGSRIYGVSAWGLKLSDQTSQRNLIITKTGESEITVDNTLQRGVCELSVPRGASNFRFGSPAAVGL
jgi:uncharacterized protein YjbI with pentapeptide repeats